MRTIHKKCVFSVVLTLVLCELVLRLYGHLHPSLLAYNPSRYLKFKARPGDFSYGFPINSDGFKDVPFIAAKTRDEYRIAAIGDSFVFSMVPYEGSFCTQIEGEHPTVNVMNFGVIGTSPEDYITILKKDAIRFAPDAVIVFLYMGNDFLPTTQKWYEYSALATVVHHSIKAVRSYKGQDIRQNYAYDDNMTPFSYPDFLRTQSKYAITYLMDDNQFRKEFDRAMLSVYAMRDICSRHRIRFSVVALPDRLQLDPALQKEVADHLKISVSAFDYLRPQKMLAETLGANGIAFVDLYQPFADDSLRKFINNDIHFNLFGNKLVATSLPTDWFKKD